MDWLTFIASLVGSVAWPLAACGIALIFRDQINSLITKVSKLKWGEVEAEFGEKVDQIREELKEIEVIPEYEDLPIDPKLLNLVETHPHLAVLEGWKSLEKAVEKLSSDHLKNPRTWTFSKHLDSLSKSGLLPPSMRKIIGDIQEVRNQAAHEIDTTVSKGRAYILLDSIADIVGYLDKLDRI